MSRRSRPCRRSQAFHLACSLTLFLSLVSPSLTFAQDPDIQITLSSKKVVSRDGKESLVNADKAKPGDVLQYEAVCRNRGKGAARHVAATVPIPAGLSLLADTAKPAAPQASLDGKDFNPAPLTRPVKNAAGQVETQPVPLGEYRALRWLVDELPPGGSTTVSLRARVLTDGGAK